MRLSWVIATVCFITAVAAVILVLNTRSDYPVGVKILRVESGGKQGSSIGADMKAMTVEFQRLKPAFFAVSLSVQARIAGRWQEPSKVPGLQAPLLWGTNSQQLELLIPARAQACRFLIEYRVGGSPYCKVYGYLAKHGLYKRFPKACKAVLKMVPSKPQLRHVELELSIPEQSPATSVSSQFNRTRANRFLLAVAY